MDSRVIQELNRIGQSSKYVRPPEQKSVQEILRACMSLLFPHYYDHNGNTQEEDLEYIREELTLQIVKAFAFQGAAGKDAADIAERFITGLPDVKRILLTDVQAIYEGDPAAVDQGEVIITYPGFYAIMVYRLAHLLNTLQVPYLPRMMSELAHSRTGIDIHPGAVIGAYFCIDHGTGVVIGETAVLGHRVKLYQGVTIGARSFVLDEAGNPVKGGKRHPDIGDNVVIYSNATILGGDTVIGAGSTIGGSVWLTHSVEEGSWLVRDEGE